MTARGMGNDTQHLPLSPQLPPPSMKPMNLHILNRHTFDIHMFLLLCSVRGCVNTTLTHKDLSVKHRVGFPSLLQCFLYSHMKSFWACPCKITLLELCVIHTRDNLHNKATWWDLTSNIQICPLKDKPWLLACQYFNGSPSSSLSL